MTLMVCTFRSKILFEMWVVVFTGQITPGERVLPEKLRWGSVALFPKPLLYLLPKSAKYDTYLSFLPAQSAVNMK